jgi:hypothetical protein
MVVKHVVFQMVSIISNGKHSKLSSGIYLANHGAKEVSEVIKILLIKVLLIS